MILAAYYEPQFRESSHGFRPERGWHTILEDIQRRWTGVKWFIELDIKGCFDHIDHEVLLGIIAKNIDDIKFLGLLRGMLKAGYVEDWTYHTPYSGTPQGGIIRPLLANSILNEFDEYVEDHLIPEYPKGKERAINPEYRRLSYERATAKKEKRIDDWKRIGQDMMAISSTVPNDPNSRRLKYGRAADDSLLGYLGTEQEAHEIKEKIKQFLKSIPVEMSAEKTLITRASKGRARFLHDEIFVNWDNPKETVTRRGLNMRSIHGGIALAVPNDVYVKWKNKVTDAEGKVTQRPALLNLSDYDIVSTYEAEIQGRMNYYTFAHNGSKKMSALRFTWFNSLAKTLAGKHKTSKGKICKDYVRYGKDGRKVIVVEVQRAGKKPVIAMFGKKPSERKTNIVMKDRLSRIYMKRNELITRLLANNCELWGRAVEVEGHHLKKLKDLKKRDEGRREKPDWVKRMIAIHRKILFVCHECHAKIHAGNTMDGNLDKPPGEPDAVEILHVRFGGGQLQKCHKVTRWLPTLR
jgi:hypothetical protein